MPLFQLMTERANARFDRAHIAEVSLEAFSRGDEPALVLLARNLAVAQTEQELSYLRGWPAVLQETVRAVLHAAVTVSRNAQTARDRRPVTLSWVPGYDYSVAVWESRSTSESAGAVTVLLSSPYPDDRRGQG